MSSSCTLHQLHSLCSWQSYGQNQCLNLSMKEISLVFKMKPSVQNVLCNKECWNWCLQIGLSCLAFLEEAEGHRVEYSCNQKWKGMLVKMGVWEYFRVLKIHLCMSWSGGCLAKHFINIIMHNCLRTTLFKGCWVSGYHIVHPLR